MHAERNRIDTLENDGWGGGGAVITSLWEGGYSVGKLPMEVLPVGSEKCLVACQVGDRGSEVRGGDI